MEAKGTNLWRVSIGIGILFLINLQPTSALPASTVYDNTDSITGWGGWTVYENGNQITLDGTDRKITSFTFYYSVLTAAENPFARVRFLQNDGISGKPNTILYDSGELVRPSGEGDFSYTINGLNILVPDTFTWSVLLDNHGSSAGEGWYNVLAPVTHLRTTNAPTIGTWVNTWYFDGNQWLEDSLPSDIPAINNIVYAAKIEAAPVPLPGGILLVASGLSWLAFLKRKRVA